MGAAAATRPGPVAWLTGVPASGKTTLARATLEALRARGAATLWLDSDDLRAVLTPNPTYTEAERDAFYAALVHLARLGSDGGAVVVISATAHRRRWRDAARAAVSRFSEVHVRADRALVEARDPKGLYAAAAAGELETLPGVGVAYEAPERPELVFDSGAAPLIEQAEALASYLLGPAVV